MKRPKTLYKYRPFSARVVEQLCRDQLYYAAPSSFNDPLDTKPCLKADCDNHRLELTLHKMVSTRRSDELSAAAKSIRYSGPKTQEQVRKLSEQSAVQAVGEARYAATHPDFEDPPDQVLSQILTQRIETELMIGYDRGIVSLAERYNCPLMWSHYGDQHHGICVGYRVPADFPPELHRVTYGGSRTVATSDVASMVLDRNEQARERIDAAVLLRKASAWRYEREWRLIGKRTSNEGPLDMTEILFGMRCPSAVKYAVISSLEGRYRPIRFYEITSVWGTFHLERQLVEIDELKASYPVIARSALDEFGAIPDLPTVGGP